MSTPPRPGPGLVGCMSCPGPQSTAGPGGIPWAWPGPACRPTGCGSGRRFRVVCRRASARRQTTRKCRKARYRQLIRPGRRGQSGKFESHTSGWRSGSKAKSGIYGNVLKDSDSFQTGSRGFGSGRSAFIGGPGRSAFINSLMDGSVLIKAQKSPGRDLWPLCFD